MHGDKIAQKTETYRNFNQLMDWCAKVTRMSVRTNADKPEQMENAVAFGAIGIGLCRTEHMFFEGDRIDAMREMILARKVDDRKKALEKLLPYQKGDFVGIFKALKGSRRRSVYSIRRYMNFFRRITQHRARWRKKLGVAQMRSRSGCTNCTNKIRCSVIAAAVSEFLSRK